MKKPLYRIRIGGVPEHFNLAWHMGIENGAFEESGFIIEWTDVPGGTGAMCQALRNNELDIAIGLTEGIILDIIKGNPSRIVQFYVNSPLHWGIYTHPQSGFSTLKDTLHQTYAISRYKSGSHLMAYVQAKQMGYTISDNQFLPVGDLAGARKAFAENEAQVFMWEKYTTKPLVDAGEFIYLGECVTPWPCFVVAASERALAKLGHSLHELMNIINLQCWLLMNNAQAPLWVAQRYGIKQDDANSWFAALEYACKPEINQTQFKDILTLLHSFRIIESIPDVSDLLYTSDFEQTYL